MSKHTEDDIDRILKNSSKAELLELLEKRLPVIDKVIVVLCEDKQRGNYTTQVMTLGFNNSYEAYGLLLAALFDLKDDD